MTKIYPSQLSGPISVELAMNHGKLLEGKLSVQQTGMDSKIFHSWKIAGLLSTVPSGKWARLSFVDYLWLSTLETMRKFGCSKKLMKSVHEDLFIKAYTENLGKKTLEENVNFLIRLSKMRPLTFDEIQFLNACEQEINDPIKMSTTNFDINYFYQLVLKCFTNNNEVGLVIYEGETFNTYEISNLKNKESNPIDLSIPHLLIPISSFIKKFIADEEKVDFLTITGLLNEQEFEVIRQIRKKNVKRLTITCNDNNTIKKIEPEVSGMIKGDDAKIIKELLGLKNYSGIELHTRDGKTLSFTHTDIIYMDK